jgi:excisionase family DNA binding protein
VVLAVEWGDVSGTPGGGRLLTVAEVAERLRTHPETVRRWMREGKLRGVRLGGPKLGWRVAEAELERFLADAGARGTGNEGTAASA